jgi:methoxymalonate biosynthesis protein
MQEHKVAVLGAGVMGAGIAATLLGHGIPVVLLDTDPPTLDGAVARIGGQLRHARLMGALPPDRVDGELVTATSVGDAADATHVVEAVTEDAAAKTKALSEISAVTRSDTPLITNTSGIPIDELADGLPAPDRLVGTHFMNPPYLISRVEVIRGRRTSEVTMAGLTALLAAVNRTAIVVRDAPGFVTSRLLHPMINDAARIVGEGVADAEAVDELMQGCLGHPTGPLRTADLIGLDNLVDSLAALHERTGEERYRPCDQLRSKVDQGHLGRKTGRGFYTYREVSS